ncbi:MAG: NAD(FAD)-utilizing dehydrogenase [Clostridiales bacterium]|nr:NAD(FAD)-utilizing dehydrogenase [Clostridiales bacterium]
MRYRLSQLKIDPRSTVGKDLEKLLEAAVRKEIGRSTNRKEARSVKIDALEIIRESIDARKKPDVKLVYTVDFDCNEQLPFDEAKREQYAVPSLGEKWTTADGQQEDSERPVVVGFGPCGMFAALVLAEAGLKPIVIERGKCVEERVADVEQFWTKCEAPDPESNVQFGEGGAGTFSDGKLTTGIKDIRIRKVLEELVESGANPAILYQHRPHIGTDKLREIVPAIRRKIERLGGEVRFCTKFEDFEFDEKRIRRIKVVGHGNSASHADCADVHIDFIATSCVILAIGHSARDTFQMLHEHGFQMEQKPFSIGVRIEHPQELINANQYGDPELAKILGPADYKLSYRCKGSEDCVDAVGRGVYTFCMCPGGQVINASTEADTSVTNGMSVSNRDSGIANSGLLVDVRTEDFADDHPLSGIEFQRKYERLAWENRTEGGMARSTYGQFRRGTGKSLSGALNENPVRKSLPAFASEAIMEAMPVFGRRIKGFDRDDAKLTAVESRSSSPVRVLRDENMQAIGFKGIIPAGEGPGYAGGIMSAAVDGIKAAEKIIIGLPQR